MIRRLIQQTLALSFYFSLNCWAEKLPDASIVGIQEVKNWANQRLLTASKSFQTQSAHYFSSPNNWASEIIYQIQVDRFNNGDASNDRLNLAGFQTDEEKQGAPFSMFDYRHGGDLQGVIERLDYLEQLGVTLLWLTPVVAHDGSYHGYCTTDFSRIDPGFGTQDDMRRLVRLAHERSIKVVMDVVVNHMCDPDTRYVRRPDHASCARQLWDTHWAGGLSQNQAQGELGLGPKFFAPFKEQQFFNRCGANTQKEMEGTGPESVFGDFVSTMFDFDTRNHDFQEIFTDLHKYWIAYADVDGFRLDAVKHVTEDFIAYFSTQTRDYAASLGKKNFLIVGEVAGPADWQGRRLGRMFSNPLNPDQHGSVPQTLTSRLWDVQSAYLKHQLAPYPGMTAAYDFAHGGKSVAFFQGLRSSDELRTHFQSEYYLTMAGQKDPRENWNLLEIHDWPRMAAQGYGDQRASILAATYLLTAEGAPIVYYGFEQGFNGKCPRFSTGDEDLDSAWAKTCAGHSHGLYRQDMFVSGPFKLGSVVEEIDQLAELKSSAFNKSHSHSSDPFLNTQHELFKHIQRLTHLRRQVSELTLGGQEFFSGLPDGVLGYSRFYGAREALIFINSLDRALEIKKLCALYSQAGNKLFDAQNPARQFLVQDNGCLDPGQVTLGARDFLILIPQN